jgi:hypothetical protein
MVAAVLITITNWNWSGSITTTNNIFNFTP